MTWFHHKHHFFGHRHHQKHLHKVTVLSIALFVMLCFTAAVALLYGMSPLGVLPIAIVFLLMGWVMNIWLDRD